MHGFKRDYIPVFGSRSKQFYRQITSFKQLGKHVRAKINDFRISLKQL